MFCRTVSKHRLNKAAPTKFNEELLDFVAGAIKAILEDVSPKKALGLAKDINRPPIDPDTKLNRDVVICNAVARLVSQLKKSGTDYTMKEVKAQAAKELKLGPGTVIAAWKNKSARALAKDFPDLIKGWSM